MKGEKKMPPFHHSPLTIHPISLSLKCLKKLSAILLLGVLVFNFTGYRWMLSYMDQQATVRLEQKLDDGDYDENQLVEVKIPLNLPYHNNWSGYEIFYGQVNYNGEYYQYVKRKLSNDTLYLLCLPHEEKTAIQNAKTEFFKTMNDLPSNNDGQQPQSNFIKLLQSEFLQNNSLTASSLQQGIHSTYPEFSRVFIPQFDPLTPLQPPELV